MQALPELAGPDSGRKQVIQRESCRLKVLALKTSTASPSRLYYGISAIDWTAADGSCHLHHALMLRLDVMEVHDLE